MATPTFIVELPLRVSPPEERQLQARLEAARQVYNACLGESLRRLALLRQSKRYQYGQSLPREDKKRRALAFREVNRAYHFSEYDLHAYATQFTATWLGHHLDSLTIQKLATRAFKATRQYAFGRRGRSRFKGYRQLDSVEGKTNTSGIRWTGSVVEWKGLTLQPIIDPNDPVIAYGLQQPVKYVRLTRRKLNGKARFYAQLVCEGKPYQKPKNRPGDGYVGLDIGPSTVAAVSENRAFLKLFCAELKSSQREIRRLQRQLDRQQRANNPANYNPNGAIKTGAKTWQASHRQKRTRAQLGEWQRRQAAYRKSLHGELVNQVLRMGNVIQLEKLSYRAWQRQFGKSVAKRAPGRFVEHLKRKAGSAGVWVNEFPTQTTKLSQTCHHCGAVKKSPCRNDGMCANVG